MSCVVSIVHLSVRCSKIEGGVINSNCDVELVVVAVGGPSTSLLNRPRLSPLDGRAETETAGNLDLHNRLPWPLQNLSSK